MIFGVTLRCVLRLIEYQADAVGAQELRRREQSMRGLLRVFGLRSEIVLRLDSRSFDKEPVNGPFIQRYGPRICDGRLHSLDALAVGKPGNRR